MHRIVKKTKGGTIGIKCKICDINETDNPDAICDYCKFSIISNKDIPPNL